MVISNCWSSTGFYFETITFSYIYINDLPDNVQSTAKLFADDASLFSTIYDPHISASQLDSDWKKFHIKLTNGKWPLEHALFFKSFEKWQPIFLHWFVAQQQTSTSRRQKFDLFYTEFSPEFNELSLMFQKR